MQYFRAGPEGLCSFSSTDGEGGKKKELAKLFDFVAEDGATFDAIYEHSARFQTYLAQDVDHPDQFVRTISIDNQVVNKVYKSLFSFKKL